MSAEPSLEYNDETGKFEWTHPPGSEYGPPAIEPEWKSTNPEWFTPSKQKGAPPPESPEQAEAEEEAEEVDEGAFGASALRITDVTVTVHRLALEPACDLTWDRRGGAAHVDVQLVEVHTDGGVSGFGTGDAGVAGEGWIEQYKELFVGTDPLQLERHARVLEGISFHGPRPWALDVALWDLAGKVRGQPVWRLLGGKSDKVRPYASLGVQRDAAGVVAAAVERVAEGFRALKLRFGCCGDRTWREDVELVAQVQRAVRAAQSHGEDVSTNGLHGVEIMVDCDQAWRMPWDSRPMWDLATATVVAAKLEGLGVYWMENALPRGDFEGMAKLRRAHFGLGGRLRIAAGGLSREKHELDQLLERHCLDVLQPNVCRTGGFLGLWQVAQKALARGIQFSPRTWGDGVCLAANMHLSAAINARPRTLKVGNAVTDASPYVEYAYDPPEWTAARRDFAVANAEQLQIDPMDGLVKLGDAPGLGLELDRAALEATRVRALPAAPGQAELSASALRQLYKQISSLEATAAVQEEPEPEGAAAVDA